MSEQTSAIDQRLAQALETATYRLTLNNQKKNARLRLEKALTYSVNGGTFKITQELISFTLAMLNAGKNTLVLMDVHGNPIEVELASFTDKIISIYYEATNELMSEFRELQKARTTAKVVGV